MTLRALALVGLLFLTACQAAPAPPEKRGKRPVRVALAPVVRQDMPRYLRAVGTVEPARTVQVRSQLTGTLLELGFREGDEVAAGQVLFRLDPRPFATSVAQARAALARDRASARHARSEAMRYRSLVAQGYVARSQADQQEATAQALEATVQADEAAVAAATLQLDYATIRAPMAGRAGALGLYPGALVRAGDPTPLVTLHEVRPVLVSFSPPAAAVTELGHSAPALEVQASPEGASASVRGQLNFVDNAVDPTTGTLRLKARFPNTDGVLWPGQFVKVQVRLAIDRAALVVPSRAVQEGQQGPFVFVVGQDRKAEQRPVTVARRDGDRTVLAAGVTPGEQVVVDGLLQLVPGSVVKVGDERGGKDEGPGDRPRRRRPA